MAHRIYTYNVDSTTLDEFPHYLGEWNYEIPELLLPLFSGNPRSKGKALVFDKESGISMLRSFYDLLGEHYRLTYKKVFYEPVNKMFEILNELPYDTFVMNARDVFNMSEEKHSDQAKDWVLEIKEKSKLYQKAIHNRDLAKLERALFSRHGYDSFLELLETDWVKYGLGYWNEELCKNPSEVYEVNGLWGLKSYKGDILAPPVYEEIFEANEDGVAVVQKNGKFGYLSNDGKTLIECVYDDANDAYFIEEKNYGPVFIGNKAGLLDITTTELIISCEYDELELLIYTGLFNAKKDEVYCVINIKGKQVVADHSDKPFHYDYSGLLYRHLKGTSKRAYYSLDGIFMGEYPEDVLSAISNGFYFAKPNKFQKKTNIIKPDGTLLDEEIDLVMALGDYGYTSFAYRKDKEWFVYDIQSGEFRLKEYKIVNIHRDWFTQYMRDVFMISDGKGWGLYQSARDRWLLPLSEAHKKVESCKLEVFRITTDRGMFYYDQKSDAHSAIYDYICEGIDYTEDLLCLFKGNEMFILDIERRLHQVSDYQMGAVFSKKYNLRGKDLQFFINFYNQWVEQKGSGYEEYFDDKTLTERAEEYVKEGNIQEAVRLYAIGVSRGNADMMVELGYIYAHDDYPEFYDLSKALTLYEKASLQGQPVAWNNLGYHYQQGIGYPQDIRKALQCFKKSAELGDGLAMQNLGLLYFYGDYVLKDYDKALEYYQQAEKKLYFNPDKIAEIYYQQSDYANLQRYLRKDTENTYSNIYYGILFDEGLGVKPNPKKAIKHFENALAYSTYDHALRRLLYYYKEDPAFADPEKYQYWKRYGEENDME